MSNQPLVSIIIPLYNAEPYILQCVKSALAQSWTNIEIIVVDDGSTDNGATLVAELKNVKIKLVKQPNKGASAARNHGLAESTGKYIQFLDADDLLGSNKIERQVAVLEQNPGCIAVCDTVHFANGTDPFAASPAKDWYAADSNDPADYLIKLYGGYFIGDGYGGMVQPGAWLTPRLLIDKAGPWNEQLTTDDDGEFFCRVILAAAGIRYVWGTANYYRKFPSQKSLSGQKSTAAIQSILSATDLKADHLLSVVNSDIAKLAVSRLYWELAFAFYPEFKALAAQAEAKALKLAPGKTGRPYGPGLKSALSKVVGWKTVKYLEYRKQKLTPSISSGQHDNLNLSI